MNKAQIKQVSLNVDEAKEFIRHIIENNRHLQELKKTPVACELEGPSGIGKTSITLQLAEELGLDMVKLSLAEIEELGDLVGFPVRQFQMVKDKKEMKNGVNFVQEGGDKVWVDENAINQYAADGYNLNGVKRMGYCPPEWIADKQRGGILLLDDYSRADVRFLQATMTLIDRQEYISWKLPKDWHIILTSNPDNGEYLVNVLDTAQKTRFISIDLKFDHECWGRWAESMGIDSRCINFLLMHPEVVTEKCNARSITTFFNSISSFKRFEDHLPMIQMIGEGSVGPEFANMFTIFINNKLDRLITPVEMLGEKDYKKVKEKMIECIGKPYRADIASVLGTRIINYAQVMTKDSNPSNDLMKRIVELVKDEAVLQNDIRYYITKSLIGGNQAKWKATLIDAEVQKMVLK